MPNNQTPPDSDLAMHRLTRIQFDPDGTGRFRWRVWAGSRLIHDELSRPETIEAILLETRLLSGPARTLGKNGNIGSLRFVP